MQSKPYDYQDEESDIILQEWNVVGCVCVAFFVTRYHWRLRESLYFRWYLNVVCGIGLNSFSATCEV